MNDYLINILTDEEKNTYLQSTNKLIANLKNAQFPNGWQKKGNYKYTSTLFWLNSLHINPVADGQTFITDFIPINKPSMFIMSRQSNHPKGPDSNSQKRQTRGIPNVFRDIYFFPSNDYISNDGAIVIINSNHLYNDSDCQQIRKAMINMYQNGTFVHPFIADASKQEPMTFTNGIPDVNRISNQSRKGQKKITNKKGNKKKGGKGGNNTPSTPVQPRLKRENTMKKNVVKINENTLKQIVAESVKKVLNEGYNQETVNEAIQALLSIQGVVQKACTQVGFNPQEGNREISKLIIQISQLIHRLEMTLHEDYYQEKWDRETHEQD